MTKSLRRSVGKKMIAGVCGGLAEYFDFDVSLMRLIFVAVALLTALIPLLVFYIVAWIIVPVETPEQG
jgi:phage shock protein C